MNCKFYSDYICKYYWNGSCHYSEKVLGGPPVSCYYVNDFENCIWFEPPIEEESEVVNPKVMLDNSRFIDSTALTIQNCDKIILKPKSLEVEVKIEKDNFEDFDSIVINGIKFKKV